MALAEKSQLEEAASRGAAVVDCTRGIGASLGEDPCWPTDESYIDFVSAMEAKVIAGDGSGSVDSGGPEQAEAAILPQPSGRWCCTR